jgi:hypothetical protein
MASYWFFNGIIGIGIGVLMGRQLALQWVVFFHELGFNSLASSYKFRNVLLSKWKKK